MTEYYTNKSDFENGKNLGFLENNVQQVVDLLNDISKAATIVQENDLSALYIAQGGATLGKDMPENDFTEAEHKVLKIMDALKDIHREVVQNILADLKMLWSLSIRSMKERINTSQTT